MSNHLAIATVSAALGQLALASAQQAVPGVQLRFGRPAGPAAGANDPSLCVYLYQISPHAALRNGDLPTRGADGMLAGRPRSALELHYLLAFYGDDQQLEPDRMLGAVARDLHARPVLGAADIADAVSAHPALAGSDLGGAFERVKFTPVTLSLDEQSKMWSVLINTPHALSVIYTASVVLLDALDGGTPALPVLRRGPDDQGVDARVGSFPSLDAAWVGFPASAVSQPRLPPMRAAQLGARLIIDGANLGGNAVALRFSHPLLAPLDIDIAAADRDAGQLRLTLPADAAAQTAWAAGLYGVAATVRRGDTMVRSPLWPLLLAPRITGITPNPVARVAGSASLAIACSPMLLPGQVATLLLADRAVAAKPHAALTATVHFEVEDCPALAGQLVRLQVDGAESLPVTLDPASGTFMFDDAQRVTIT
ncbi:DUF4255 domain-containing protein [Massilia aurea]|uniref:DUF4255 domain-containing protein n=1 Tax=Massilia aurea TaxID=373040 RepID=UPI00346220D1